MLGERVCETASLWQRGREKDLLLSSFTEQAWGAQSKLFWYTHYLVSKGILKAKQYLKSLSITEVKKNLLHREGSFTACQVWLNSSTALEPSLLSHF